MRSRGFTLIELLAAVAIIAVLALLALPNLAKFRASSDRSACAANLRHLGQAMNLFAGDDDNRYPSLGVDGGNGQSWDVQVLPFLDGNTKVFACPTDVAVRPRSARRNVRSYTYNPVACSYDPKFVEMGASEIKGEGLLRPAVVNPSKFPLLFEHHEKPDEPHVNRLGSGSWIVGLQYDAHGLGQNAVYADGHVAWVPVDSALPEFPDWADRYASNLQR